jgi:hypothetical protein
MGTHGGSLDESVGETHTDSAEDIQSARGLELGESNSIDESLLPVEPPRDLELFLQPSNCPQFRPFFTVVKHLSEKVLRRCSLSFCGLFVRANNFICTVD